MVTRKDNADIDNIIAILKAMSDEYGATQNNTSKFQLFNSTKYNGEDLLFYDSATVLVGIAQEKQNYQSYLGDDYVKDTEALKSCDFLMTTKLPPPKAISTAATPYTLLVMFTLLLAIQPLYI